MHRRKALGVIGRTIAAGVGLSLGLPLIERKARAEKKGETQKLIKSFKIPEKDYNLYFIMGIIVKTKDKIKDMKIGTAGYQSFKLKRVYITSDKWFTAYVTMKPDKTGCKPGITLKVKVKGKKGHWKTGIPFKRLAKRYQEKTGQKLKYVTVGVDKHGDVDIYIVPARTFENAQQGKVEAGFPVLVIPYDVKKNVFKSGFGRSIHNIVKG